MNAQQLLDEFAYSNSPNFLQPGDAKTFDSAADFSHIFRRASERFRMNGVYALRQQGAGQDRESIVPVVYVCEADSESEAQNIHRFVWNQNVVPFILIVSRGTIRLHSGFRFDPPGMESDSALTGVLRVATTAKEVLSLADSFRADRIDDGTLWQKWGRAVTPETRVDWKLLDALNALDQMLQTKGLGRESAHSLIGKYVYLFYLRDRDILSDRKLAKWGIEPSQVFTRDSTLPAFNQIVRQVDEWLNGSMFPIAGAGSNRPDQEHIRRVAATLAGDNPVIGQLSLPFKIYDFSSIPIETLSVVYEQFLHAPRPDDGKSRGRLEGAYYTPIPLVNFMLEELDAIRPLTQGMRVLDPACGSGAFLVQCYRRIIEQDEEFQPGKPMRPARLRTLLERHIFGVDRDADACRVAELSLSLALLDYVDPPDLESTPTFKLPNLHESNIFTADFFDSHAHWKATVSGKRFDWIVGNPPWTELKRPAEIEQHRHAWAWIQDNQAQFPVGGNQIAEAFSWAVLNWLAGDGAVALLLPAMTLFKDESSRFRRQFFSSLRVHAVANFANLAEVLFPGHRYKEGRKTVVKRPRRPAAAFFYSHRDEQVQVGPAVSVFSPLVADQCANLPNAPGKRKDVWNIVVDANRLVSLDLSEISSGGALPWKTAMWGSALDRRLLSSLASRFDSLHTFCKRNGLALSEGLQLRTESATEPTEHVPELAGKLELKKETRRGLGLIFEFPKDALVAIEAERCFVRKGRVEKPLRVCRPPHIIVDKLRRFAVFSDEFIAIPPRQIGIAGEANCADLLRALSLYLISDFALYHQFLVSPEWGVSTSISTLDSLRKLPIPLPDNGSVDLAEWAQLHRDIVTAAESSIRHSRFFIPDTADGPDLDELLRQLNERVFAALGLRDFEQALVSDLVDIRMQLIQGKVSNEAMKPATREELNRYAITLRDELDAFVEDQSSLFHAITVVHNGSSGMAAIELQRHATTQVPPRILSANSQTASEFKSIRDQVRSSYSQWIYFERNLRIFDGDVTYLFKPRHRLAWTRSQALVDAGIVVADTIAATPRK